MPSTPSVEVLLLFLTISGKHLLFHQVWPDSNVYRLLDKIAKDIMVCENKTVRRWDGSIGDYKKHLRTKMVSTGAV